MSVCVQKEFPRLILYRIVSYCIVTYPIRYIHCICVCVFMYYHVCVRERERERESMCVCVVATSGGFVVWCFFYLLRLVDDVEFDTGRRGGGNSGLRQQGHGAVIINSSWC